MKTEHVAKWPTADHPGFLEGQVLLFHHDGISGNPHAYIFSPGTTSMVIGIGHRYEVVALGGVGIVPVEVARKASIVAGHGSPWEAGRNDG